MSFLDNMKKKAEELASDARKIADKTLKDTSAWTDQAINDTKERTLQAKLSSKEWTTQKAKDITDFASDTWENAGKYTEDMRKWTKEMPDKLQSYSDNFNIEDFWNKLTETAKKVGQDFVFMALTIFYSITENFKNKEK